MENCLNENELAEYADYLCYGAKMPDAKVLTHVEKYFRYKQEIMEVCDMMVRSETDIT